MLSSVGVSHHFGYQHVKLTLTILEVFEVGVSLPFDAPQPIEDALKGFVQDRHHAEFSRWLIANSRDASIAAEKRISFQSTGSGKRRGSSMAWQDAAACRSAHQFCGQPP